MTNDEFNHLQSGDIVRHKLGSEGYIVHSHNGQTVDIVRVMHITNPSE